MPHGRNRTPAFVIGPSRLVHPFTRPCPATIIARRVALGDVVLRVSWVAAFLCFGTCDGHPFILPSIVFARLNMHERASVGLLFWYRFNVQK